MPRLFSIRTQAGAYAALVFITVVWGLNWVAMKLGLQYVHPVLYNIERTAAAIVLVFAVMLWERRSLAPQSWRAAIVIGLFQTAFHFGATTMALASGGAGRTSVLVFTMPFWTMLLAWPVLSERVRGTQWLAVVLMLAGLLLVVQPWQWQGGVEAKLWATLSGLGLASGTVATRYFQRRYRLDMLNLTGWQMMAGLLPTCLLLLVVPVPPVQWTVTHLVSIFYAGVIATGIGFVLLTAVLGVLPAGTTSLNMLAIPVIGILSSMAVFGEHITPPEWIGISAIGLGLGILSMHAWRAGHRLPGLTVATTKSG